MILAPGKFRWNRLGENRVWSLRMKPGACDGCGLDTTLAVYFDDEAAVRRFLFEGFLPHVPGIRWNPRARRATSILCYTCRTITTPPAAPAPDPRSLRERSRDFLPAVSVKIRGRALDDPRRAFEPPTPGIEEGFVGALNRFTDALGADPVETAAALRKLRALLGRDDPASAWWDAHAHEVGAEA